MLGMSREPSRRIIISSGSNISFTTFHFFIPLIMRDSEMSYVYYGFRGASEFVFITQINSFPFLFVTLSVAWTVSESSRLLSALDFDLIQLRRKREENVTQTASRNMQIRVADNFFIDRLDEEVNELNTMNIKVQSNFPLQRTFHLWFRYDDQRKSTRKSNVTKLFMFVEVLFSLY